jgi:hypothetical protein
MRIDTVSNGPLAGAADAARDAEAAGYDGVMRPEIAHDPFLAVALGRLPAPGGSVPPAARRGASSTRRRGPWPSRST